MITKILLVAIVLVVLAQAYVRLSPLPEARLVEKPGPAEAGVYPRMNGVTIVQPLADLPDGAFERLLTIAAATPRTARIGDGDDPAAFVTRSKLWGFPDVTVIWQDDEMLHLDSGAVFGRSDLGVNAARAARWLERLEAAQN